MTVELGTLTHYLDEFLRIREIPDSSGALNGLQVEGPGPVSRILAAVDASQASIDAAVVAGANLLLVHHGLFWGGLQPVVDRHWARLRALIENGVAVYSVHIPLDCHPEVGNNAVLANALGLTNLQQAGEYKGVSIGFVGSVDKTLADFVTQVEFVVGKTHVIPGGPERISRVGVVTGGAGSMTDAMRTAGADTFLTGEGNHHSFFDATEGGINLIYAGHYATETFGVKALAAHIERQFEIPWEFFDYPTGL